MSRKTCLKEKNMARTRKLPENAQFKDFAKRFEQALAESEPGQPDSVWAKKFGTTGEAVRTWRSGDNIPSGKNLIKICLTLGCSADWLLLGQRMKIPGEIGDRLTENEEWYYEMKLQHKEETIATLKEQIELYKKHQDFLEAQMQHIMEENRDLRGWAESPPGVKKK